MSERERARVPKVRQTDKMVVAMILNSQPSNQPNAGSHSSQLVTQYLRSYCWFCIYNFRVFVVFGSFSGIIAFCVYDLCVCVCVYITFALPLFRSPSLSTKYSGPSEQRTQREKKPKYAKAKGKSEM